MNHQIVVPSSIAITARRFTGNGRRTQFTSAPMPPRAARSERRAKIAKTLALAHHVEASIQAGRFEYAASVYRSLGLDNSRLYQVLSLRRLAPDIQEDVLFLTAPDGVEPFTEKALRAIARILDWAEQRQKYAVLRPAFARPDAQRFSRCDEGAPAPVLDVDAPSDEKRIELRRIEL